MSKVILPSDCLVPVGFLVLTVPAGPAVTREASRPRRIVAAIDSPHNAHLEVVVLDRQRRLEMLEARTVAEQDGTEAYPLS